MKPPATPAQLLVKPGQAGSGVATETRAPQVRSGTVGQPARPAFPARLPPVNAAPVTQHSATKIVASPVIKARANGLNDPKITIFPLAAVHAGTGFDAARQQMVAHLAAQGVSNPRVLAAMGSVQRHRFVDSALASQGYVDTSLPIGLGQTISKPNVVARMLELLCNSAPDKLGRVLEIGTGCGYQAALLSQLACEVYSMERLRGLHNKAIDKLRFLRLPNVHLLFGDGMPGYAKGAPYAAIIAAASGADIPPAWIDQLAVGGRLVAPVHTSAGSQALVVVDKTSRGTTRVVLEPVSFVPLKSGTGL